MTRRAPSSAVFLATLWTVLGAWATVAVGHGRPETCCPACGAVCQLKTEKTTEKKHCYQVEHETICIPPIHLPWPRCCERWLGGRTRTVRVLKKVDYECPVCKYSWSVDQPTTTKPIQAPEASASSTMNETQPTPESARRIPSDLVY